ncbi:MAG TPA: DUF3488 and transglutaminase-like domain-containing protein [Bryobacteraceae bacterium]|nr:DUF3488 and transglutaminase-like domain-containing protein [Bryobacteraceae bacterium]
MPAGPVELHRAARRLFEYSVVGLAATGFAALATSGQLSGTGIALVVAAVVAASLRAAGVVRFRVPATGASAAAVAVFAWAVWDRFYGTRDVVHALVHLIPLLAAVQLLAASRGRDFVFVKILALLELFLAAVVSASVNFFLYLALFVLFGVASFASGEILRSAGEGWVVAREAARRLPLHLSLLSLIAGGAILMLTACFFLVLPRTAGAALRRLVTERTVLAGFSEDVRLGQIGEILQRSTPVMRVRVHQGILPAHVRWRGTALVRFDGRRWFTPPAAGGFLPLDGGRALLATDAERRRRGARVLYEVHLLPAVSGVVFVAGVPEVLWMDAPGLWRNAAGTLRVAPGMPSAMRYAVHSFLGDPGPSGFPLRPSELQDYLQLPPLDPRVPALAQKVTQGAGEVEAKARALEAFLATRYGYTLELPAQETADPLAYFLFERRKGHCEYFASAMAVMLRTLGIPSRVITGFHAAAYNPVSGWYVVRSSDAHSWVEAWIPGRGWLTFDPTPPAPARRSTSVWARLGFYLDAAEMFWQEWVVGYDRERQLLLAVLMGDSGRSFGERWLERAGVRVARWRVTGGEWIRQYGPGAALVASGVLVAIFIGPRLGRRWSTWRRVRRARQGQASASDATLLYGRLLEALRRRGFERPAWLTPREFVQTLPPVTLRSAVAEFTDLYYALRFGARKEVAPRLTDLLERLEDGR